MLWKLVVALNPASVRVTTIAIVYAPKGSIPGVIARTLIGPKDAKTGEPRENDLTAAFATNAETSVLVMSDLFFFVALDNVVIPSFTLPARKDFIADPAFV